MTHKAPLTWHSGLCLSALGSGQQCDLRTLMSVVITWESFMSQLMERGQVTVPVLSTEMSTPCLLAFTVWPATPQLDSLQAVTSLARGSRSFQSLPAYLGSSDLTRASEPTINLQSMTSFCVQRLTGFEKALEQLGPSPWTLSLGSVERKQGFKHKPWRTHFMLEGSKWIYNCSPCFAWVEVDQKPSPELRVETQLFLTERSL